MNILIVEDDTAIREGVAEFLKENEYEVFCAEDGEKALEILKSKEIHLALLDIMLPKKNGIEVLKELRTFSELPVIMLTAKTEYMDKITGLTLGADDYIPKPFNPLELVARVKAQLRRYTQYNEGTKEEGDVLDFGGLLLNRTSHECVYNEVPLTLTPIEFDILWLLCENRGKVISSEELFEKVWHEKYYKNSNNTVMVHIRHLREKMSAPTGKSDLSRLCGEWAIRLKNNYRKLKFSILLQTVLVTALTVLVGGVLLKFVIDGIYNDSFARFFCRCSGVSECK